MRMDGYRQVCGAWIHVKAQIGEGVIMEPGAMVGAGAQVGARSWIGAGAKIADGVVMGEENQVHAVSVLGGPPQDVIYKDERTHLRIGDRNVFREGVTVSRASTKGDGVTRIGSDNYFMAGSHVGHDCVVDDHVMLANDVLIAGHCRIGSHVSIDSASAIVQFSTIGRYAAMGALTGSSMDCEPFIWHDDMPARPKGINVPALRQALFPEEVINSLREAYQVLFGASRKGGEELEAARCEIELRGALCGEVLELLEFMKRSRGGRFGRRACPALSQSGCCRQDPGAPG